MISDIERHSDDGDREDSLQEKSFRIRKESTQRPSSEPETPFWIDFRARYCEELKRDQCDEKKNILHSVWLEPKSRYNIDHSICETRDEHSDEGIDDDISCLLHLLILTRWEDHLYASPSHTDHGEDSGNTYRIGDEISEKCYRILHFYDLIRSYPFGKFEIV